ncbi:hypothetical protein EJ05DRAFT_480027 [Pseudovirgaria hyperparasitica]|uniref:Uncharacterized protein n=1 Tax=Pseudovirgaria hyperparasitica TaxID=470096 RepID=A0A6A6VWK1_9PEZI|nr:uncharacterized protein EJ05DRAFT_480027 [Pseudovirgaria hyperparasitica]KAF2754020.1 hypothetical protein EJ05DRAFT_480027 [Pseudovirgaria hyperparasitica]
MPQGQNSVYVNGSFSEPMTAQHNFNNQYDLSDPHTAMSRYSRVMHKHTKEQMEIATQSARRRSENDGVPSQPSLQTQTSGSTESEL